MEETPEELESEPESEPEPVLTPEPDSEPDQDLKSEASEMTNPTPETTEETCRQVDACGDIRKVAVCEKNSFSTSQVHSSPNMPSGHCDFTETYSWISVFVLPGKTFLYEYSHNAIFLPPYP